MAEERVVFKGTPSPVTIIGSWIASIVLFVGIVVALVMFWNAIPDTPLRYAAFALLLIPLGILLTRWIKLKLLRYEITTERIKVTHGLLTRRTDELELYRVKDTALLEPFLYRLFSVGNVFITTHDSTNPELELKGIKGAKEVREKLRQSVEACRVNKGARIMEME